MQKLKIAIIGAGNIGHCHANAYQKLNNVEITAVCDINRERADQFAQLYQIPHVYDNHSDLLAAQVADAVSVCVWNNAHAHISIDALNSGVHVLCEKPMALNTAQCLEMEKAAESNHKVLIPGFCTRYEEGIQLLKRYIAEGRLGRIYYVKAIYLRRHGNPGGWFSDYARSGGGPVIDLGVHVLDLARYLAGGQASAVTACTNKIPEETVRSYAPHFSADAASRHDVEDFASAFIRMDNGVSIQFETSWNHHIESDIFQIELYGDKGGVRAYPKLRIMCDDMGTCCNIDPYHSNHEENPNYDFDKEIEHFTAVIRKETGMMCSAKDGTEVMRMVDAIYQSARESREIIIVRE